MRKLLVSTIVAATLLAVLAPWKLMILGAEALYMRPGNIKVSPGTDKYWEAQDLQSKLHRMGWSVTYVDGLILNEGDYGNTTYITRAIKVDSGLSWNERFTVLAHEAGHTMQPGWLTTQQSEIFAESVAALMSGDGIREHARYVSRMKPEIIPTLLVEWREIYRVADALQN